MPSHEETRVGAEKKTVHASERQSDRVALDRWFFLRHRITLDPKKLLFFDESGVNLSMARRYGRGPRGERVEGYVPKNWGESVTLVAGIGLRGLIAPLMLDGSMTGNAFEAYIEQAVLPHIEPGDVLVWDNLSAHRRTRVIRLINRASAHVLFLPPYSPDLNPIELAWSKVKTFLRSRGARTVEALEQSVAEAFSSVTTQDIVHWLSHCGYE